MDLTGGGRLEALCIDFMNSSWRDWRGSGRSKELLDSPDWVAEFLGKWGLQVAEPLTEDVLTGLKQLRDLLFRMTQSVSDGEAPAETDVARLNGVWRAVPERRRLVREGDEFRMEWVPLEKNWYWVQAAIASSFAEVLAHREPERLKVCANPDCLWVYYDESRNRHRRWCDDSACGNLMKVRRFRARQKANANPSPPE